MEILKAADYIAQFYDRDTPPDGREGHGSHAGLLRRPTKVDTILADLEKDRPQIFAEQQ